MTVIKGGRFRPTKYDKKKFSDNFDNIFNKKAITPPSEAIDINNREITISFKEMKVFLEENGISVNQVDNMLLELFKQS